MIKLIYYFENISGTLTTILDLYNNLMLYKPNSTVELTILYKDFSKILKYKKYLGNIQNINFENIDKFVCNSDILIINCNTLKYLIKFNKKLNYNNIIILDTSTLFEDSQKNNTLINYVNNLKNKLILGNPFNKKFFKSDYLIYYHKFSKERMNTFKSIQTNNKILNWKIYKKALYKDVDPFSYYRYNYMRWRIFNNMYFENIGKLIFEFLYLNKEVYYFNINKCFNDGLTYYLRLFDIDDNINQKIEISNDQLEEILFFNDEDEILRVI